MFVVVGCACCVCVSVVWASCVVVPCFCVSSGCGVVVLCVVVVWYVAVMGVFCELYGFAR